MTISDMRKDGYPLKIIGNGGYPATLVDCQPLFEGDYMGIYRYPGGDVWGNKKIRPTHEAPIKSTN